MATKLFQAASGTPAWFHETVSKAAKADSPIAERIVLGPELAAEVLRNNLDNRLVRVAKLSQLVDDIRAGRWIFNGEPILISKEGLLNDGQHRALAVLETNTPIDVMMIFGLERSSRITVDQGAAKSACDYLAMENIANSTQVAAIGRLVIAYELADGKNLNRSSYISSGEVVDRFIADDEIARAATFASSMHRYSKRYAPPSLIGLCFFLLSRVNAQKADTYMRQICIGEEIKRSDPAFAVREGLTRERVTREEKVHIIFRGWNAYRQGRKLDLAKVVGHLPALI